ncbi:phage tail protein [Micromonospora schwarzwaldensis]|uniref:phage tail protein n=1 Tax=Micromonospora sp. DSM 45708 TaxID=3111767 RepID=UPI0031D7A376
MSDVGSARVEVTGDVRNFARQTERDLDRALSRIKTPTVDIKADVDVDRERLGSSFAGAGTEAAQAMTESIGKGLGGLSSALGSNPYVAAAGAAIAATIAAVAAPAIGALLSGALIGGAGLGVIGLGAWLLREEPALKAAASSLTGTLKSTFTDAAKPMLGPLVEALGRFEELVKRISPQVSAMFKGLADSGAIQALAEGLAGLVENALPGFQELITAAGPFLKEMAAALPILGTGLSVFFSAIADGGPGAALFFKDFLTFISAMIAGLGVMLGWLSSVYPTVRQFFIDAAAWIQGAIGWLAQFGASVGAALAPLVPIFTGVWQTISAVVSTAWKLIVNAVTTAINVVKGVIAAVSAAIRGDWQGTWNGIKSVVSAVLNGIRTAVSTTLNGIKGVISGALSTIRAAWTAGWNAMVSVVTGAASRVRSAVTGLRQTVIGAFAAAGSWLADAGRRIIDGLISGIRSGFDRVRSTLSSLTSMLPDWKGPAEVDDKILYDAGQRVMKGFRLGIEDQRRSIQDTLRGLTGDLPSWTAGRPRGGDGASAGGSFSIGELHVHVSGATGREAGEEAAEAVLERLGAATLAR